MAMPSISTSITPASRGLSVSAASMDAWLQVPAPPQPPARRQENLAARSSLSARFAAPGEDLLRPEAIPAGDLGNDCVRLQRLRDDPCFVIHRLLTPTASTVNHLKTSRLTLRVKRKVKSRHKPISDPNAEPATSQIATTPERWSRNTAYEKRALYDDLLGLFRVGYEALSGSEFYRRLLN